MGTASYPLPPSPQSPISMAAGFEPPKPVAAIILSLLAGALILFGGLIELIFLTTFLPNPGGPCVGSPGCPPGPVGPVLAWVVAFGALGVVAGSLIIGLAVYLYSEPRHHVVVGTLIAVLSVLSAPALGGFGLGLLLGLIGGILAAVWKPWPTPFSMAPPPPMWGHRVCMKCGRLVSADSRFCPYCGNNLI